MANNNDNRFSNFDFNSEFIFVTSPPDEDIAENDPVDNNSENILLMNPLENEEEELAADETWDNDEEKAAQPEKEAKEVVDVKPENIKKEKKKLSPAAFIAALALKLLLICVVVGAILALANAIISPIIAKNELEKKESALRDIFPEHTEYQALELTYENPSSVYAIKSGDNYIGYASEVSAGGFGGDINLIVGIDLNRNVKGIKVISHSETTEGTSALADSYLSLYSALSGEALVLGVDIDAVSGATITSEAINTGVNTCLAIYEDVIALTGKPEPEPEPEPEKAVFTKERVLNGMYGWEDNGKGVIEIPVTAEGTMFDELSFLMLSDGSLIGYLAKITAFASEFEYAELLIGTYYGRIQGVRFIDYEGAGFDKIANKLHEYIVPNYKYNLEKTKIVYGENIEVFEEADLEARLIAQAAQTVLDYNGIYEEILAEALTYKP